MSYPVSDVATTGSDGYAPIFSYIGGEGYMLDCELRPGSQHCQKALAAKGLLSVKTDAERKRLRKVIDDPIRIGCKLACYGKESYL